MEWPTEYRYPDRTYRDRLDLEVGGTRAELHHARGETDDHTWTWFPDHRVLCCGDLFIWASPNAGNPRRSSATRPSGPTPCAGCSPSTTLPGGGPEVLLPGHGYPVVGADRVRQALTDTAELLESLVEQTLALMNGGARLDEVIHTVDAPARLMDRPYLQPVYDEPEFIVRTVWRLYGGWWDGNPATLKPAPERRSPSSWPSWPVGPGCWPTGPWPSIDRGDADVRRPDDADSDDTPCGWPGTWPSWPGWPRPTTRACNGPPHGLHPPGRGGHLDHGPRGVLLGGTGVRGRQRGPAILTCADRPSMTTLLNWEFAAPEAGRRSTSNSASGAH